MTILRTRAARPSATTPPAAAQFAITSSAAPPPAAVPPVATPRIRRRELPGYLVIGGLILILLAAVTADLLLGRGFGIGRFAAALADPTAVDGRILRLTRMPRVATALLAGAALGVAGAVLQAVLRNPLASPELTGVNGLAVLGVIVAVTTGAVPLDAPIGMLLAALAGGLFGGVLGVLFAGRGAAERLLFGGVLVGAGASGLTILLISLHSDGVGTVSRWLVGSVDGRTWTHLTAAAPWIGGWIVVLCLASGVLPLLAGGDRHAAAIGLDPVRTRMLFLGAAVCLIAGATALAGAITFIGFGVPHLARALVRTRIRLLLPVAALLGATLLTGCDALAQLITGLLADSAGSRRLGIPAGAVAAFCGAIALVVVSSRKEPSR